MERKLSFGDWLFYVWAVLVAVAFLVYSVWAILPVKKTGPEVVLKTAFLKHIKLSGNAVMSARETFDFRLVSNDAVLKPDFQSD